MFTKSMPPGVVPLAGLVFLCGALSVSPCPAASSRAESGGIPSRWGPNPAAAPPEPSDGVVDVRDFGALGNGVTDDSLPVQAAIDALSEGGGTVFFPAGRYRITRQLVLPNDGEATNTRQPSYVFSGTGALFDGRGGAPSGGTVLDLRHPSGPKIVTHGLGLLEASGITFADFGTDSQPFLYTTNTTLHIHNCAFYGTKTGTAADNDAIILGGTNGTGVGGLDSNAPFQGYGTVIRENYFGRIRRMVYGRVFANAVAIYGNTVWNNCGSNLTDGAAIELDGDPDDVTPQANGGWYVAGNLIEVTSYPYAVKCEDSERSAFIANNFYDPSPVTIAYYRFEPSGSLNYVLAGFHDDSVPLVSDAATGTLRSTVVDFHQSRETSYPQSVRVNRLFIEPGASSPYGPRLVSSTGAELTYQMAGDDSMVVWNTPSGGNPVPLWQVKDYGGGAVIQELKGTDARLRNLNGSLKLHADAGSFLELGDTTGAGIRIEDGELALSSTSARILSGTGIPTEGVPDGSIYLRADGGQGSTLYVREAGAWVAK